MMRKKSSFLTFIFSLLPGAGQMYMGFMKRGVSLMSIFFFTIFFAAFIRSGLIALILPIIWFFSFFDTHNLRSLPNEEFYAMEDDFIIFPDFIKEKSKLFQNKYRNVFAVALILIGIFILWNNMLHFFRRILPNFLYDVFDQFGRTLPQLLIGVAIIAFGIYLIRGKKKELDELDNSKLLEDKRGN